MRPTTEEMIHEARIQYFNMEVYKLRKKIVEDCPKAITCVVWFVLAIAALIHSQIYSCYISYVMFGVFFIMWIWTFVKRLFCKMYVPYVYHCEELLKLLKESEPGIDVKSAEKSTEKILEKW